MIARVICEDAFRAAVADCDPARLVHAALARAPLTATSVWGVSIGKAALAMARGAGAVTRGVVVTNAHDGRGMPAGWHVIVAGHPEPDARSLQAGDAVIDLLASAGPDDQVLVLVSGGASSLVERPLPGITLDQLRIEIRALMASGAPIAEINAARIARSAIKGGKLAALSLAPVRTLVTSDVIGDDLAVIGSGPTIPTRGSDRAELVAPMELFATSVRRAMVRAGRRALRVELGPMNADVAIEAARLERTSVQVSSTLETTGPMIAWGEPTVHVPVDHGDGGRAQQLALELAKLLRGSSRSAFVVGSDGIDGPAPRDRPAPAGAYIDGMTWDAIMAAGIDPDVALARCDAGTALAAVGALVITGPTGINHADLVIVG